MLELNHHVQPTLKCQGVNAPRWSAVLGVELLEGVDKVVQRIFHMHVFDLAPDLVVVTQDCIDLFYLPLLVAKRMAAVSWD